MTQRKSDGKERVKPGDFVWVNSLKLYNQLKNQEAYAQLHGGFNKKAWQDALVVGIVVKGPFKHNFKRPTEYSDNYDDAYRIYTHMDEFLIRRAHRVLTLDEHEGLNRAQELRTEIGDKLAEYNRLMSFVEEVNSST